MALKITFFAASNQEGEITINRNYEPPSLKELTDPSMSYWVHHTHYLLEQGRVTWRQPGKPDSDISVRQLYL